MMKNFFRGNCFFLAFFITNSYGVFDVQSTPEIVEENSPKTILQEIKRLNSICKENPTVNNISNQEILVYNAVTRDIFPVTISPLDISDWHKKNPHMIPLKKTPTLPETNLGKEKIKNKVL